MAVLRNIIVSSLTVTAVVALRLDLKVPKIFQSENETKPESVEKSRTQASKKKLKENANTKDSKESTRDIADPVTESETSKSLSDSETPNASNRLSQNPLRNNNSLNRPSGNNNSNTSASPKRSTARNEDKSSNRTPASTNNPFSKVLNDAGLVDSSTSSPDTGSSSDALADSEASPSATESSDSDIPYAPEENTASNNSDDAGTNPYAKDDSSSETSATDESENNPYGNDGSYEDIANNTNDSGHGSSDTESVENTHSSDSDSSADSEVDRDIASDDSSSESDDSPSSDSSASSGQNSGSTSGGSASGGSLGGTVISGGGFNDGASTTGSSSGSTDVETAATTTGGNSGGGSVGPSSLTCTSNTGSGSFQSPINITLSCSSTAVIKYCISQTCDCDPATGTVYTGAFEVGASTDTYCMSFKGVASNGVSSSVEEMSYLFNPALPDLQVSHQTIQYQTTELGGTMTFTSNDFGSTNLTSIGVLNLMAQDPAGLSCTEIVENAQNLTLMSVMNETDATTYASLQTIDLTLTTDELTYGDNFLTAWVKNGNFDEPDYACTTNKVVLQDFPYFESSVIDYSANDQFVGGFTHVGFFENSSLYRGPAGSAGVSEQDTDSQQLKTGILSTFY